MKDDATVSPSRLREGLGEGLAVNATLSLKHTHPRPLPQAGGENRLRHNFHIAPIATQRGGREL